MKNVGCVIETVSQRAAREIIQQFSGIPVANIGDCMNRMAALPGALRPLNQAKLLGTAFTVRVPQGDNLMLHKAMDLAEPGDIIIIDAGGGTERAIFGEIMVNYCMVRGIAGLVVDGYIRDYDTLSQLDFPVYAAGVSPNGPYKNGPGEIGTNIAIGGVLIRSGDIVVGDADGIVVIRPEDAEEILVSVTALNKKETEIIAAIQNQKVYPRPWVDEKLNELNCEYR